MISRYVLVFSFIVSSLLSFGQNNDLVVDDSKINKAGIVPSFSINNTFLSDYYLGMGFGVFEGKNKISARMNFDFRPYFRNVTFKENDTLYSQYKEKDYMLSLSVEKIFALKKNYPMLSPYIETKFGYMWGNFKGWDKSPEDKWFISPSAGAALSYNENVHFKLGYQYLKSLVHDTAPHRISLQVLFVFN